MSDSPRLGPSSKIEGLPEGVELVRIGAARDDEFEIINGRISKGARSGAASGVIVRPSEGYAFISLGIRDPWAYESTKTFPEKTVVLKFSASNDSQLKRIQALQELPGFVSIEEVPGENK